MGIWTTSLSTQTTSSVIWSSDSMWCTVWLVLLPQDELHLLLLRSRERHRQQWFMITCLRSCQTKRCKLCHQRGTENQGFSVTRVVLHSACRVTATVSRTFTLSNCQTLDRERFNIKLFDMWHVWHLKGDTARFQGSIAFSAPLYLRTLWRYTNAVITIIINRCNSEAAFSTWNSSALANCLSLVILHFLSRCFRSKNVARNNCGLRLVGNEVSLFLPHNKFYFEQE